jgi:thiol-disulfide isomerase/thioredoxin
MKCTVIFSLLLTLALVVGCDSASKTKPSGGQTESQGPSADSGATTDTGADHSATAATPTSRYADPPSESSASSSDSADAAATIGDEATLPGSDAAVDHHDPVVIDEEATVTLPDAIEGTEEADAAPPTQEDFQSQLMAAVRENNMDKALEVVNAALVAFPEDVGMQVNRFLLHLRMAGESEKQDPDGAVQKFFDAASLARELKQLGDQLPPEGQRVLPYAFFNEARAYARQGKVAESLQSLREAVDGGLVQLDFATDDFFASVRDLDQFKAGLDELMKVIRQRLMVEARKEIDEAESYAFDFELPGLDSQPVKLSDFKGKLVIADIWGTWCPPCRAEIPHFIKLQEAYPNDLAIVGINYEGEEGDAVLEKIRTFANEQGMNYPCVIGDPATQEQIPNFQGYPTTLFLDREGKVRLTIVGLHPYEKLDAYVNVLLAEGAGGAAATESVPPEAVPDTDGASTGSGT